MRALLNHTVEPQQVLQYTDANIRKQSARKPKACAEIMRNKAKQTHASSARTHTPTKPRGPEARPRKLTIGCAAPTWCVLAGARAPHNKGTSHPLRSWKTPECVGQAGRNGHARCPRRD